MDRLHSFIGVAAVVAGVGMAFGDVALTDETTYNVASGTNTVSDKVSGAGSILKTGTGTLVLGSAENDFTGGIHIKAGQVDVATAGAFGTGAVTVDSNVDTAGPRLEILPADGSSVTIPNAIAITGSTGEGGAVHSSDSKWSVFFGNAASTTITLTGAFTATRDFRLRQWTSALDPNKCAGPTVVFETPLNAAGHVVNLDTYGTFAFNRAIAADTVVFGQIWSCGGFVKLASSENAVKAWILANERVLCEAGNVLGGGSVSWHAVGAAVKSRGYVDLQGYDQRIAGLDFDLTVINERKVTRYQSGDFQCVKSTSGSPTLTIVGASSDLLTYATLRGSLSLRLDAADHPDFVQTFAYNDSPMSGSVEIANGTLKMTENAKFSATPQITVAEGASFVCASTNAAASLPAVAKLVVDGTFDASSARVNPFTSTLTTIELGANAVFKLPEGSTLDVTAVKIGETTCTSGVLTPDSVPQLKGGVIVVLGTATPIKWTGSGSDAKFSTADNWSATPDLAYGSQIPTFATGGSRAIVDVPAAMLGLNFDRNGGFTLARTDPARLLSVAGTVSTVQAGSGDYVVDTPIRILGDRAVKSADGPQNLVFRDAFAADNAMNGTLTIGGTNVVFEGTNVIAGRLVVSTNKVVVRGLLANPDHAYTGVAEKDSADAIYEWHPSGKTGFEESGLILDDATIEKSIAISQMMGTTALQTCPATTNEIKGHVKFLNSNWIKIFVTATSQLTLSGGVWSQHSFRLYKGGRLRIAGTPGQFTGSAGLNPHDGTVELAVPGNWFNYICIGYNDKATATVVTTVDYAITNGSVQVGGNGGSIAKALAMTSGTYTLDLQSTTQACERVGVMKCGILTGRYPAMLEVTAGRPASGDYALDGYSIAGQVTGGVGFHMRGADLLLFTNRTFTSCGDLKVSNGTMEFSKDAFWPNGTNVTVCGTGTLKLGSSSNFNGKLAVLRVAGTGKLDLATGVVQVFNEAYATDADGVERRICAGVYSKASLDPDGLLAGHFADSSVGLIRIRGKGTLFIFR